MLKKVGLSLLAFILCFSVMGSTQVFAAEAEVVEDENHNYVVGYIVAPVAYSEDGTVTAVKFGQYSSYSDYSYSNSSYFRLSCPDCLRKHYSCCHYPVAVV